MNPTLRSLRRRCDHASFVIDEDVVIRASFLVNRSLRDEGSGAGPSASSMQEDVDLAVVRLHRLPNKSISTKF